MSEVARAWTDLLARRDVLILDVETTGLGDSAEVVEIALLDTAGRVVYDAPIMPQGRISKGASDIHGLTRKRLKELGVRPWPEHQTAIAEALGGASVVLAYNLDFDARMVNQTIERYGIPFDPGGRDGRCLMLDYAAWRGEPHEWRAGEYRWHKLQDAYRRECKRIGQQHRALADCRMALELMQAVVIAGDRPVRRNRPSAAECLISEAPSRVDPECLVTAFLLCAAFLIVLACLYLITL